MKRFSALLASFAIALALTGCGGQGSSSDAPIDFKVTAGDASVTATWTAVEGVDYWIFYAAADNITTTNWVSLNGRVLTKATSPQVISGLTNGTLYSFTINGRKDGGPGGPGTPSQSATPRLSGINWNVGPSIGTERLTGVAVGVVPEGAGQVAVSETGKIYTSVTTGDFAAQTSPVPTSGLNTVVYSSPGFVIGGANGTVLQSVDARTWTSVSSNTGQALFGAGSAGLGNYALVGAAGTIITSANGTEWALRASGTTATLRAVTYGGGNYVAVGDGGTILTSANGTSWAAVAPVTSAALRAVGYVALSATAADGTITVTGIYVAVGEAGTLLTSNDAATWTLRPALGTSTLNAIVYGGQFVTVGDNGAIFTSPDGVNWTARTSGTTRNLTSVARSATGYVAAGDAGTYLISN